jgi:hypothetical protein
MKPMYTSAVAVAGQREIEALAVLTSMNGNTPADTM